MIACEPDPGKRWHPTVAQQTVTGGNLAGILAVYSRYYLRHINLGILRIKMLNSAEMKRHGNQKGKQILLPLGISEDIMSLL